MVQPEDMRPLCQFQYVADQHYGTVITTPNGNYNAVNSPTVVVHTYHPRSSKGPEHCTITAYFNVSTWDGDEFVFHEAQFASKRGDARNRLSRRAILGDVRADLEDDDSAKPFGLRRDLWECAGQANMLLDMTRLELGATRDDMLVKCKAGIDVLTDKVDELESEALQEFGCHCDLGSRRSCRCRRDYKELVNWTKAEATTIKRTLMEAVNRLQPEQPPGRVFDVVFWPGSCCSTCDVEPIVDRKFSCAECNLEFCFDCGLLHPRAHELKLNRVPPAVTIEEEGKQQWIVSAVTEKRMVAGVAEYRVEWAGYEPDPVWYLPEQLGNRSIIDEFERGKTKLGRPKRGRKR